MEHQEKDHIVAVAARYVRRRWRGPARTCGLLLLSVGVGGLATDRLLRPQKIEAAGHPAPVSATGVVESQIARGVGAPFDARVLEVPVRKGIPVKRGDVLFRLDTAPLRSELARAKSDAALAAAALADAKARRSTEERAARREVLAARTALKHEQEQYAAWRTSVARASSLLESEGAVSGGSSPAETPTGNAMTYETGYPYDASRLQELQARVALAEEQLSQVRSGWEPIVREAAQHVNVMNRQVRSLEGLLAMAVRRSPIDGIVTSVSVRPGEWANRNQPLVRVDDPAGYRLVTLVDQQARDQAKAVGELSFNAHGQPAQAKLEKIVAGEGKELFYYYLWLKPENANRLHPGQQLPVVVPVPEARLASAAY